jgi:hypothetical protein
MTGNGIRPGAAFLAWLLLVTGVWATVQVANAAGPASGPGPGGLYRWVDEQGVVHYGDRVPPQYAQQGASVLNKQGVVVGQVDAAKNDAQLALDARARADAEKRMQHDAFLLATYTSVKDIETLRDERLGQIQGRRAAAEQFGVTLTERLSTLRQRALGFKPYSDSADARKMPDDLAEQMVHTLNDIRTQRAAVSASEQDEVNMRQQFQADIERYRELRAAQGAAR